MVNNPKLSNLTKYLIRVYGSLTYYMSPWLNARKSARFTNRQFNLNFKRTRREFIVACLERTPCIPRRNGWFTADHVIKPRRRCNGESSNAKRIEFYVGLSIVILSYNNVHFFMIVYE